MSSKSKLTMEDLANRATFFDLPSSNVNPDTSENVYEFESRVIEYANIDCLQTCDEDTYEEGQPFELLAKKMEDLTGDGKIRKRIIREGTGEKPEDMAVVKIHYNLYVEFNELPVESTYAWDTPKKFTVNDHQILPGLEFAVQTMREQEKAQILIHPDYAYGKCAIGKVPPDSTVLFEIELEEIVDPGVAANFEKLPPEQQKQFPEVYEYALAMVKTGKKQFTHNNIDKALQQYNLGLAKLEDVVPNDPSDLKKHRELCLRLYTNLVICYTRKGKLRRAIENAEKAYKLTENGELMPIPVKILFHHARCLKMLNDFDNAKIYFSKALKIEPNNTEIANEIVSLDQDIEQRKGNEKQMCEALLNAKLK